MSATVMPLNTPQAPTVTIRQRVADALTKDTTSGEVRSCIAEVQGEIVRVDRESGTAKALAVHPLSSEKEAQDAKAKVADLAFERERLVNSTERLEARLTGVERAEDQAKRRANYDEVVAERDELAARLEDRYPKLADEIADLMRQIQISNGKVASTNLYLPDSGNRLSPVENVARGVMTFGNMGGTHPISLVRGVTLVPFDIKEAYSEKMVWYGRGQAD